MGENFDNIKCLFDLIGLFQIKEYDGFQDPITKEEHFHFRQAKDTHDFELIFDREFKEKGLHENDFLDFFKKYMQELLFENEKLEANIRDFKLERVAKDFLKWLNEKPSIEQTRNPENRWNEIFRNYVSYQIFKDYFKKTKEKTILADISYIFHIMDKEKRLLITVDNKGFKRWFNNVFAKDTDCYLDEIKTLDKIGLKNKKQKMYNDSVNLFTD